MGDFDIFDLDRPELEPVKSALEADDVEGAAEALKEHFESRQTPLFFEVAPGSSSDLFSSTADEIIDGLFRHQSGEMRDFSNGIDWDDPWSSEPGVLGAGYYNMMDFGFLPTLTGSYLALEPNDPKRVSIIDAWLDTTLSYATEHPNYGHYNRLGEAKRLTQWVTAFSVLRSDSSIDPEKLVDYITYMHGMASNLWQNVESNNGNNWYISIGRAFYLAAVYFPEFRDASMWELRAEGVAERFIAKHLKADGLQYEPAINYQYYSLTLLLQMEQFGQLNGKSPVGHNFAAIERLADAMLGVTMPNGRVPLIGDTTNGSLSLSNAADVFDRDDMRWIASGGTSGTKPELGSTLYPQSYGVMRTGWEVNDSYLLVNNQDTDYAASHRHPDDLSIVLYAHGRPLLVDPGADDYNDNPVSNWLRRTTRAHNTVEVNGLPQPSTSSGPRQRVVDEWATNSAFDYYDGAHDDYAPIEHSRSVFFAKPDVWIVSDRLTGSETEADYRQFWHGPSDAEVTADQEDGVTVGFGSLPGVTLVDVDQSNVEVFDDGIVADGHGAVATDVDYFAYTKSGDGAQRFDTVLVAGPAGSPVEVEAERLALSVGPEVAAGFAYTYAGEERIFYRSEEETPLSRDVDGFETDARALHLVMGAGNNLAAIAVVGGTSLVDAADRTLFETTEAVGDLAITFGSTLEVNATHPILAPIHVHASDANAVEYNGQPIEFTKSGDIVSFTPPAVDVIEENVFVSTPSEPDEGTQWKFAADGMSNFNVLRGDWQPTQSPGGNGVWQQTSTTIEAAMVTTEALGSGALHSRFVRQAGGATWGFGHYLGYVDAANYLLFDIYRVDGVTTARIVERKAGVSTVLASAPIEVQLVEGVELESAAEEGALTLTIDGTEFLSTPYSATVEGAAGLYAHRIAGEFTDVGFSQAGELNPWNFAPGDLGGWRPISGDWAPIDIGAHGGVKKTDAAAAGAIIMAPFAPRDVALDTSFVFGGGAATRGAGIYLRYQDARNAYLLRVYRSGGAYTADIIRILAGTSTVLSSTPISITPSATMNLRGLASGDQIELWIDGVLAASAQDDALPAGTAALWSHRSDASFSDIRATPLAGPEWRVLRGTLTEDSQGTLLDGRRDRGSLAIADMQWTSSTRATAEVQRVDAIEGAAVGVVTRASGGTAGYYFTLSESDGVTRARIERLNQGSRGTAVPVVIAESVLPGPLPQQVTLEATSVGDVHTLTLDGVELLRVRDSVLVNGSVGIVATGGRSLFLTLEVDRVGTPSVATND